VLIPEEGGEEDPEYPQALVFRALERLRITDCDGVLAWCYYTSGFAFPELKDVSVDPPFDMLDGHFIFELKQLVNSCLDSGRKLRRLFVLESGNWFHPGYFSTKVEQVHWSRKRLGRYPWVDLPDVASDTYDTALHNELFGAHYYKSSIRKCE
jgi:hypothetical protein